MLHVKRLPIIAVIAVLAIGSGSSMLEAGSICGLKRPVYYDSDRGMYFPITRVGSVSIDYTRNGQKLKGTVIEFIGPDGKIWMFHGPTTSSFFLTGELEGVSWHRDTSKLPPSFRVINNRQEVLFRPRFLRCE